MGNFHAIANWIEAGVWTVVAILLAARAIRSTGRVRRILGILSAAFLLFGVSDVIEAHTGAWWRPLGLLIMKGACLVVIAWGFWTHFKIRSLSSDKQG